MSVNSSGSLSHPGRMKLGHHEGGSSCLLRKVMGKGIQGISNEMRRKYNAAQTEGAYLITYTANAANTDSTGMRISSVVVDMALFSKMNFF